MNRSQVQTMFHNPSQSLKSLYEKSGGVYTFFIIIILVALEIFSFSTVKFALRDLLGDIGVGATTWGSHTGNGFLRYGFDRYHPIVQPAESTNAGKRRLVSVGRLAG